MVIQDVHHVQSAQLFFTVEVGVGPTFVDERRDAFFTLRDELVTVPVLQRIGWAGLDASWFPAFRNTV